MSKNIIESFDQKISIERILGNIKGDNATPTIIVIAGMHGNETAGVYAAKKILHKIDKQKIKFKGNFYVISGNLNALQKNIRFDTEDLNRLWTHENIEYIKTSNNGFNADVNEQISIYEIIKDIISNNKGPFYFIDLHTTSSDTTPFITISDSLNNRKFSSNFSIPIVLGIEEYLDGPLLTYINEFGHVALGFEGGQHNNYESIDNCEAFVWLALVASGCIHKSQVKKYNYYKNTLLAHSKKMDFYEIDYRYLINGTENFMMIKGFNNFEKIKNGQVLALSNNLDVKANMDGMIFMPLYQDQGDDGFFIITKISRIWLHISAIMRKLKLYHLLRLLPGIKMDQKQKHTLIVNPKTAKFLAIQIFHLFGYRKQIAKDNKLHFIKRDRRVSEFK